MTLYIILHNSYLLTSLAHILVFLILLSIKREGVKAIQIQAKLY